MVREPAWLSALFGFFVILWPVLCAGMVIGSFCTGNATWSVILLWTGLTAAFSFVAVSYLRYFFNAPIRIWFRHPEKFDIVQGELVLGEPRILRREKVRPYVMAYGRWGGMKDPVPVAMFSPDAWVFPLKEATEEGSEEAGKAPEEEEGGNKEDFEDEPLLPLPAPAWFLVPKPGQVPDDEPVLIGLPRSLGACPT